MTRFFQLVLLAAAAATTSLQAAPIFWAIGSDSNGIANQLIRIDVDGSSVTNVATVGSDPDFAYNGGLVVNSPTSFTGFENDIDSNVGLVGFDNTGSVGSPSALGTFRPMGLTGSPGGLHWLEQDGAGDLFLNNTSSLNLDLGIQGGFGGGLTYRSTDGLFYALGLDGAAFYSIDATNSNVQLVHNLVAGLVGGLVWDPTSDLFYVIGPSGNDSPNSALYSFGLDLGANPLTEVMSLDQEGVVWSALAIEPSEVPEPSTWLLMGAGLLSLGVLKRKRA